MRVWFNRHFSVVARVAHQLRNSSNPLPLEIVISHRHFDFVGYAMSDIAFTEPADLSVEAYVDWMLEKAVAEKIDVIIPGHEASAIVAAASRFRERGVRVLEAAAAEVLPQLHRKQWVYDNAPADIHRPAWELITEDEQLEAAVARIEQTDNACIKPTIGVYGHGYHRIASAAVAEQRELAKDELSVAQWRGRYRGVRPGKPQMVMAHLPGNEYSVDMACKDGVVLAMVQRRKPLAGNGQRLVEHPEISQGSRQLVEKFGLSGLINIQFKEDKNGRPALLEINPRASGGIGMSCLSGINLPDIAFRACLFGEPSVVPPARLGMRVGEMSLAVELPEPRIS